MSLRKISYLKKGIKLCKSIKHKLEEPFSHTLKFPNRPMLTLSPEILRFKSIRKSIKNSTTCYNICKRNLPNLTNCLKRDQFEVKIKSNNLSMQP